MSVFRQRKVLTVQNRTVDNQKNPENLQDFTENNQKNTENNQYGSENKESEIDESKARPGFLNNFELPVLPKIYVQRPFMRRIVFFALLLFVFPILLSLTLAAFTILAGYWFIKVIVG